MRVSSDFMSVPSNSTDDTAILESLSPQTLIDTVYGSSFWVEAGSLDRPIRYFSSPSIVPELTFWFDRHYVTFWEFEFCVCLYVIQPVRGSYHGLTPEFEEGQFRTPSTQFVRA